MVSRVSRSLLNALYMGSSLIKSPALRPYKKDHTRDPNLENYPQKGLQRVSTLVFDHPKPTRNPNPKP